MRLSAKSPSTPERPQIKPNTSAWGIAMFTPGISVIRHQMTMEPTRPPMKPSQLFFGEMRGASLCLPNLLPTKYANESFAHTLQKMPHTSTPPQMPGSDMRTKIRLESSRPVYAAPKNDTPTSPTRARMKKTYHTSNATSSAPVTRSEPESPSFHMLMGYATAASVPSSSLGSFASLRSMKNSSPAQMPASTHSIMTHVRLLTSASVTESTTYTAPVRNRTCRSVGCLNLSGVLPYANAFAASFFATAVCMTCSYVDWAFSKLVASWSRDWAAASRPSA